MLSALVGRRELSYDEAYELGRSFPSLSPVTMAACLAAFQTKGYAPEELAGMAQAMRDASGHLDLGPVADTCGTGGDRACTINVSTASALVISCFFPVAKHGNRAVTSHSGSMDVLGSLGIRTDARIDEIRAGMATCRFAYLHAPLLHASLAPVMPVRRELGVQTVFNIIGPLANPARPHYQLIGVADARHALAVAEGWRSSAPPFFGGPWGRYRRGAPVQGNDGLPRSHRQRRTIRRGPRDFGLTPCDIVPCASPAESARRIMAVLAGEGTKEDETFVTLNASLALSAVTGGGLEACRERVEAAYGEQALGAVEAIRHAYPL
jgi:anthranilate phosphoribosyltransferase